MNIGFIGVGNMGSHIVNLMIDGGHELTLWARRSPSLEPFAGRADFARLLKRWRGSDLVGICVWDEHDVEEVVLGEKGVLAGIWPDAVIAVHSTISRAGCPALPPGREVIWCPVDRRSRQHGCESAEAAHDGGRGTQRSRSVSPCPGINQRPSGLPGTNRQWPDRQTGSQHDAGRHHSLARMRLPLAQRWAWIPLRW